MRSVALLLSLVFFLGSATGTVSPTAGTAPGVLEEGIRLGLVVGPDAELEQRALTRGEWSDVLAKAFSAWDRPGQPLSVPGGDRECPITAREASESLTTFVRMVRRRLGLSALTSLQGIRFLVGSPWIILRIRRSFGVCDELSPSAGLAPVLYLLRSLPCPPGTEEPAAALDLYYTGLNAMVGGREGAAPGPPVCGQAAANLKRNLEVLRALSGDETIHFALVSLKIQSQRRTGLLAEVVVHRRMLTVIGPNRSDDTGVDTFRLRLASGGWLIYE